MMSRGYLSVACFFLCSEICSGKSCAEPPPVANTYRTLTSDHVQYTCIDNHVKTAGDFIHDCVDGEYNGTAPVCELQCGPPRNNGDATMVFNGSAVDSEVTYMCSAEHLLNWTTSECDAAIGRWTIPKYCFKDEPIDHAAYTAVSLSSVTILNNGSSVSNTTSGDVTQLQECIRTIGEENKPNINVTLDQEYNINHMVFKIGDFVSPLTSLQVRRYWNYHRWKNCQVPPKPNDTVEVTCGASDGMFMSKIQIIADFGVENDSLEICNLEIYARPRTTVDCGRPMEVIYAMRENEPLITFYTGNSKTNRAYYSCKEGFHVQAGRGYSFCDDNGIWTTPIVCTDKVNLLHGKRAWISASADQHSLPELTDFNTSTCADIKGEIITVDLGIDVQISDVTVVFTGYCSNGIVLKLSVGRDLVCNVVLDFPRTLKHHWGSFTVDLVREDGTRTRCGTGSNVGAVNVYCPQHPTGRLLDIKQTYREFFLCEIIVHGRVEHEDEVNLVHETRAWISASTGQQSLAELTDFDLSTCADLSVDITVDLGASVHVHDVTVSFGVYSPVTAYRRVHPMVHLVGEDDLRSPCESGYDQRAVITDCPQHLPVRSLDIKQINAKSHMCEIIVHGRVEQEDKVDLVHATTSADQESLPELIDSNTSTCRDLSDITLTVDLGTDVQVSDVTVSFREYQWSPVTVDLLGGAGIRTSCGSDDNHMASISDCPHQSPVRSLDIKPIFGVSHICEIIVHGRVEHEALECYMDYRGRDYRGTIDMTIDGIPCQGWSSTTPHSHGYRNGSMFPDSRFRDVGNYCRNPNNRDRPWCFTTDPDIEWQYCPIQRCNRICIFDEKGTGYTGGVVHTTAGKTCKRWTSPDLPFKQKNHVSAFSNDYNFCRNPLGSQSRPWCYTSVDGSQYGFCSIPPCPTTADMKPAKWIINDTFVDLKMDYCNVWNRRHLKTSSDTGYHVYRVWLRGASMCPTGKRFNTTFICYKLQDSSVDWISGTIECVNCGRPPVVSNATVHYTKTFLASIATYTCLAGYMLASGSDTATCLHSGVWSAPDALCLINCRDPPLVEHATPTANSTLDGDEAVYTCVDGTKYVSGSDSITCLATGEWKTPDYICMVYCGPPPSVNNASVSESTELEGARVLYTCQDGFTHVSGLNSSTCLSSGDWTDPEMHCEVDCGDPPTVDNTAVSADSTVLNSTALYSCDPGYTHVTGSRIVMCRDTGLWEEPEIICIVNCGDPYKVEHAVVSLNSSLENSTCVYSCAEGYGHASGSPVSTCRSDGNWEPPTFTCLINCEEPPSVEQATPTVDSTLEGGEVVYTCVDGTKFVSGSDSITCLATGEWSTPDFICTVYCGSPPSVNNTSVSESTELEGARVLYTCQDGFTHVSGSDSSTCLRTGNWTDPHMHCEVDCGDPYEVEHAIFSLNSTLKKSTCVYSCAEGYGHASGSPVSRCRSDGNWEPPTFTCLINCGEPPPFEQATSTVNSTLDGDEAVYTCVDGKKLSGSDSVTCLSSGEWSLPDFICIVHCGPPPFVNNTSVSNSTELEGALVLYTCRDGFRHVSGSDSSTCLSTGNWKDPQIHCEELVTTTLQLTQNVTDKYGRVRYASCTCRCKVKLKPVKEAAKELTEKLTLKTKQLASFVQKKTSKPDERSSSKGMAVLAGCMMAFVGGVIIIPDILAVVQLFKS